MQLALQVCARVLCLHVYVSFTLAPLTDGRPGGTTTAPADVVTAALEVLNTSADVWIKVRVVMCVA